MAKKLNDKDFHHDEKNLKANYGAKDGDNKQFFSNIEGELNGNFNSLSPSYRQCITSTKKSVNSANTEKGFDDVGKTNSDFIKEGQFIKNEANLGKSFASNGTKDTSNQPLRTYKGSDLKNLLITENNLRKKVRKELDLYNGQIIDQVMFRTRSHIVCVLKEIIKSSNSKEFLRRMYWITESRPRVIKLAEEYQKYVEFFPTYAVLPEGVYIMRGSEQKSRCLRNRLQQLRADPKKNEKEAKDLFTNTFIFKLQEDDEIMEKAKEDEKNLPQIDQQIDKQISTEENKKADDTIPLQDNQQMDEPNPPEENKKFDELMLTQEKPQNDKLTVRSEVKKIEGINLLEENKQFDQLISHKEDKKVDDSVPAEKEKKVEVQIITEVNQLSVEPIISQIEVKKTNELVQPEENQQFIEQSPIKESKRNDEKIQLIENKPSDKQIISFDENKIIVIPIPPDNCGVLTVEPIGPKEDKKTEDQTLPEQIKKNEVQILPEENLMSHPSDTEKNNDKDIHPLEEKKQLVKIQQEENQQIDEQAWSQENIRIIEPAPAQDNEKDVVLKATNGTQKEEEVIEKKKPTKSKSHTRVIIKQPIVDRQKEQHSDVVVKKKVSQKRNQEGLLPLYFALEQKQLKIVLN